MSYTERGLIRNQLKAAYPDTKFYVWSWSYEVGASWTDGATEKEVKKLIVEYLERFGENTSSIRFDLTRYFSKRHLCNVLGFIKSQYNWDGVSDITIQETRQGNFLFEGHGNYNLALRCTIVARNHSSLEPIKQAA